jgi:hypothetical protein
MGCPLHALRLQGRRHHVNVVVEEERVAMEHAQLDQLVIALLKEIRVVLELLLRWGLQQ